MERSWSADDQASTAIREYGGEKIHIVPPMLWAVCRVEY